MAAFLDGMFPFCTTGSAEAVTMNPALIDKWRSNGGELKAMAPEEFGAFLKTESAKGAAVIRRNNIRID